MRDASRGVVSLANARRSTRFLHRVGPQRERRAAYEQRIRLAKHPVVADEPEVHGGKDAGPVLYALVVAGLAACMAMTLQMYAERKRWKLEEVKVDLKMFRDGEAERVERAVTVTGELPDEAVTRLSEIAEKTPVTKTLKRAFTIAITVSRRGAEG